MEQEQEAQERERQVQRAKEAAERRERALAEQRQAVEAAMRERRAREESKQQEPEAAAAGAQDDALEPGTAVECRYGGQVCSRKPRRTRVLTNTLMRTPAHTLVHAPGAPLSGKDWQQKREWDL